jgi:drug/metabolite transporter (DMT)-like permease
VLGGLLGALGAAACYEVAYVVQAAEARAVGTAHALRASLLARLAGRPRWLAATVLSLLGAGLQVLALGHAPLSVVQPVLAGGLILLLGLSRLVLGERSGRREATGVIAVLAGVIAVAAAHPPHVGRTPPGAALAAELVLLTAVAVLPFAVRGHGLSARVAVLGAAAGDAVAALALKLVADELHRGAPAAAAGWAALAAVAGLLALTAEMSALQRLRATAVAPVVLAAQVLVPVVTAVALLGERWGATPLGGGVLGAGVLLVAAGAALLGSSPAVGSVRAARVAEALEDDGGRGGQAGE